MVRRKSWHLMLVTLIVESSLEVDESCGATLAAVKYVSADHGARSGGRLDDGRGSQFNDSQGSGPLSVGPGEVGTLGERAGAIAQKSHTHRGYS